MSTLAAPTLAAHTPDRRRSALRWAQAALVVGAAGAVALAAMVLLVTTTDDGKYQHTGDYFLTANGIPCVLALLVLLPALRALQQGRDGRLGQTGIVLAALGGVALLVVLVHGLAAGVESSLGPTYVLGALATIVGVILFAAGSWRTGLLPRWLLLLWVFAWTVGSMLPILGPGGFLLAAVYLTMAALLPRRLAALDSRLP
jgi:MFS family permease